MFLNKIAVFKCKASDADYIYWKVNDISYSRLPEDVRNATDIVGNSELSIPGTTGYNRTRIQCVAGIQEGTVDRSAIVILYVQGKNPCSFLLRVSKKTVVSLLTCMTKL